jgi:predicted ATPase
VLTLLGVKGYKCLRNVEVPLGPFNVLIGPNDSGKSSFLEAFYAVSRWAAAPTAWPLPEGGDVSWILQAKGSPSEARQWRKRNAGERCSFGPLGRPDEFEHPSQVSERLVRDFGPSFAAVSAPVSIDPAAIRQRSPIGSGTSEALIASRGRGTAAYLAKVALGDRARHELIRAAMERVTEGRVVEIIVGEPNEDGYPLSFRLYDGTVIGARELSSGLLVYLFFLVLVHREDAPRVLLIEEPETGLHPHRIHEVIKLLRTLNDDGVQIVLTTHSPEVLSVCEPDEVRVFLRPHADSGTEVHALAADFKKRMMRRDTLGGIWASEGEDGLLERTKHVIPIVREPAK